MSDNFYVGIVTPVVHYTMGGLRMTPDSAVADAVRLSHSYFFHLL